jgi:hypothetical protein
MGNFLQMSRGLDEQCAGYAPDTIALMFFSEIFDRRFAIHSGQQQSG